MLQGPIVWEAFEYNHIEKSTDWFWGMGIVTFSVALIAFLLGNTIFAIVVIISAFALGVAAKRQPKLVRFELNKSGVLIDKDYKAYGTLRSFWVDNNSHHDGESRLFFRTRGTIGQVISIPLDEVNPLDVREFLLHHLLEEEYIEPFLQKMLEHLGF